MKGFPLIKRLYQYLWEALQSQKKLLTSFWSHYMLRPSSQYVLSALLLLIYGAQVCPFLESLTITGLAVPMFSFFAIALLARYALWPRQVAGHSLTIQPKKAFYFELQILLVMGLMFAIFNTFYYSFPFGSGLKLFVGISLFALFIALDSGLQQSSLLIHRSQKGEMDFIPSEDYSSLPVRISILVMLLLGILTIIFFLVIGKDLEWLQTAEAIANPMQAKKAVLGEFAFILLVIMAYSFVLVRSYAGNLKNLLHSQNHAMQKVAKGDLNCLIPVASNDELGWIAHHSNVMIQGLKSTTEALQKTQATTINTLASLAETRDNETGNHILRTQRYVKRLAEELAKNPDYQEQLPAERIELLYQSAPLHDIGKVGIPDAILLKPSKLTFEEFEIMKEHPMLGSKALVKGMQAIGENSFLKFAKEIAETHHEKWDGSGYPKGLQGEGIPLSGRLMAVADVYDALISKRVYKKGMTHEEACKIIIEGKGSHFDPTLIKLFESMSAEFYQIAQSLQDH